MFDFSDKLSEEASIIFGISLTAIVVWIIGSLMAAAAIIVISLGKIGLGMAIALAPIFIPALMFKATSNLFESWVRFTLGFALIPLVMAGVVGAIVGIGQGLISQASAATTMEGAGGFLIVGVGAIFMTLMVPTLVNGLSGTITATANGVAMAMGGAGIAGAAAIGTGKGIRAASQAVAPVIGGEIRGHQAGRAAEAVGGNYWEARNAEMETPEGAPSQIRRWRQPDGRDARQAGLGRRSLQGGQRRPAVREPQNRQERLVRPGRQPTGPPPTTRPDSQRSSDNPRPLRRGPEGVCPDGKEIPRTDA